MFLPPLQALRRLSRCWLVNWWLDDHMSYHADKRAFATESRFRSWFVALTLLFSLSATIIILWIFLNKLQILVCLKPIIVLIWVASAYVYDFNFISHLNPSFLKNSLWGSKVYFPSFGVKYWIYILKIFYDELI